MDAFLHVVSQEHREQPGQALAGLGPCRKSRGDVANGFGVAEIIAHELFHGQQTGQLPVAAQLGNPHLFGAVEHFRCLAGVKMQLVTQAQQKLPCPAKRAEVFFNEQAQFGQFVGRGRSVTDKTYPADELNVAQSAAGTFNVRLQQEHGFAVAEPFFQPGAIDRGQQKSGAAVNLPAKEPLKIMENPLIAQQQPRIDQGRADFLIAHGQAAGLLGRAHAMTEYQAGVEYVAQQSLGKGGQAPGEVRGMQDHQIHVAKRGHLAPTITPVLHQGNAGE